MNKKKFIGFLLLLGLFWTSSLAWAAPTVYLNGKELSWQAILQEGRVLVGVREIAETLNFQVDWEAAAKTVKITQDNNSVVLVIGSPIAWINGQSWPMEVPAQIEQGRTMVPVRLVSEALGLQVNWNQSGQVVELSRIEEPDFSGIWYLTDWQINGESYPLANLTLVLQEEGRAYFNLSQDQDKGTWTATADEVTLTDSQGLSRILLKQNDQLILDYSQENCSYHLTFAKKKFDR